MEGGELQENSAVTVELVKKDEQVNRRKRNVQTDREDSTSPCVSSKLELRACVCIYRSVFLCIYMFAYRPSPLLQISLSFSLCMRVSALAAPKMSGGGGGGRGGPEEEHRVEEDLDFTRRRISTWISRRWRRSHLAIKFTVGRAR